MHSRNRHGPAVRRVAGLFALVLAFGLGAVQEAWAGNPHLREGVIFGIGVGYSPGRSFLFPGDPDLAVESDWEFGPTPQIRLGYAVVKNRLLVTVANQQWLYEQGVFAEDKLRVNAQNWTLEVTWCPGNPQGASGGLYLVGAIGIANARMTLLEPIEDDPYGNKFEEVFKQDESGTAYQVGIGYEWRLAKSVAAGLSASYVYQTIGGEIFDYTEVIPVNLTLNWYW